MENRQLKITPPEALTVSRRDIQTLLDAGDGDAALAYLRILQGGGVLDLDAARDMTAAVKRLEEMGLITAGQEKRSAPIRSRELPEYRTRDILRRSMESREFQELVETVQMTLGRILSSADLQKLFGIYDELALPPEVILMLVQHCKEEYESRYGTEKSVGFRFIAAEAEVWFQQEIMTYEQAEQWLRERERRKSLLGRLQHRLGIRDRALSATERKYMESWIDLGFAEDAIAEAADRTITNTGALKWKYMDSILRSWHGKGLHTPEEIEKGDPLKSAPRTARPAGDAVPVRDDAKMLAQLTRLREKMKQG